MKTLFLVLPLTALLSGLGCNLPGTDSSGQQASLRIVAKNAPSNIDSLTLTVSGPGLGPTAVTYTPPPDSLVLEVPAGKDRKFELTVNVGGAASAALVYEGEATANLQAGVTTDVTIGMNLTQTRLVIPDRYNNRIVMIDDMGGGGWMELNGTDLGYTSNGEFEPYDIAIDGQARTYIANAYASTPYGGVFRIDDMADRTRETIQTGNSIQALALDNVNGYVYYIASDTTTLYRKRLEPLGGEESFDLIDEPEVSSMNCRGLSVDQSGMVYLTNSSQNEILKINPNLPAGSRVLATFNTIISNPWDVMVNSGYVYVTNFGGADGYKIVRLNTDLTGLQSFGNATDQPLPQQGEFWGPERFIAVLNRKITIIDEGGIDIGNWLVSFDNILGEGWQTYGETGTGMGQFKFFNMY